MKKISYAERYKTTLSQDIDAVASKGYGRNATPNLFEKKDIDSLITQNCPRKTTLTAWNILKNKVSLIRI